MKRRNITPYNNTSKRRAFLEEEKKEKRERPNQKQENRTVDDDDIQDENHNNMITIEDDGNDDEEISTLLVYMKPLSDVFDTLITSFLESEENKLFSHCSKTILDWYKGRQGKAENTNFGEYAAREGKISILKEAIEGGVYNISENCNSGKNRKIFLLASRGGHLDFLLWYMENVCKPKLEEDYFWLIIAGAAAHGRINILEWARNENIVSDKTMRSVYLTAVSNEQLSTLKWARRFNYKWHEETSSECALTGNLDIMKWLLDNGCPMKWENMIINATRKGFLQMSKWIEGQDKPEECRQHTIQRANLHKWPIRKGNMEMLNWIVATYGDWSPRNALQAAACEKIEILKLAEEKGWVWKSKDICTIAAEKGNLELLKWAREHNCPWDRSVSLRAAEHGHLEILKWAVENGCENDKFTFYFAISQGHNNILRWGLETKSFIITINDFFIAVHNGRLETLQLLTQHAPEVISSKMEWSGILNECKKWEKSQGLTIYDDDSDDVNNMSELRRWWIENKSKIISSERKRYTLV